MNLIATRKNSTSANNLALAVLVTAFGVLSQACAGDTTTSDDAAEQDLTAARTKEQCKAALANGTNVLADKPCNGLKTCLTNIKSDKGLLRLICEDTFDAAYAKANPPAPKPPVNCAAELRQCEACISQTYSGSCYSASVDPFKYQDQCNKEQAYCHSQYHWEVCKDTCR